jgi:protein-tyrosine phosphatase
MRRRILFVCMGNICRSPAAEGVFRDLLKRLNLESEIGVDSAGTIAYHGGDPPDQRMQETAGRRGYQLQGRARVLGGDDLEEFDLVVAMDKSNYQDILDRSVRQGGSHKARICLLSDFLDSGWPQDVPDPFYGGSKGFELVLDMIETACPAILRDLSLDE